MKRKYSIRKFSNEISTYKYIYIFALESIFRFRALETPLWSFIHSTEMESIKEQNVLASNRFVGHSWIDGLLEMRSVSSPSSSSSPCKSNKKKVFLCFFFCKHRKACLVLIERRTLISHSILVMFRYIILSIFFHIDFHKFFVFVVRFSHFALPSPFSSIIKILEICYAMLSLTPLSSGKENYLKVSVIEFVDKLYITIHITQYRLTI